MCFLTKRKDHAGCEVPQLDDLALGQFTGRGVAVLIKRTALDLFWLFVIGIS